ncbi:MAG TPA: glutamate racemase [Candidatus Desulfovibrio intestinipullorum]|uniref:Glutamate racemase n=1 Tax=Candidatus Desulfovibrio intestinipullorum TaxID=2838536 RepID=A0A9D1PZ94_9BACT|nr:glutamate racemase [Candidatus Desulfovibrio intestinipullorum]
MSERQNRPIGIFDSGVGGMTVLRALLRQLPAEEFSFLGDTARLPYGTKGRNTIIEYTLHAARRLVESHAVKMLVVACNTASSVSLPALRVQFPDIPVVGVIEPGARAAVRVSPKGRIAVLATEATVRGGAYVEAIHRLNPEAQVVSRACTLFVALAEEGWLEGEVVEGVVRRYLADIFAAQVKPDTLLLGCTHFPLLQKAIARVVGSDVHIVDSAQTTAEAVSIILKETGLARTTPALPAEEAVHFMATDNVSRFAATGALFLGRKLSEEDVELVDI